VLGLRMKKGWACSLAAVAAGGLYVLHIRKTRRARAAEGLAKANARKQIHTLFTEGDYEEVSLQRSGGHALVHGQQSSPAGGACLGT
jgi:hypothetical protein